MILLQHRAAAGGVDDDPLDTRLRESFEILPCQAPRLLTLPRMRVQRSAAPLGTRSNHLKTVGSHQPHGGIVDLCEENRHHTTGDKTHPPTALALGWRDLSQTRAVRPLREHGQELI